MRAAVYYHNRDVRIEERPVPEIGPEEVLVRVETSGICGSDVLEWYRRPRAPLVLGHEIGGTVEAAGASVRSYRPGDRITAAHHVPCDACRLCLRGHQTLCDMLRRTNFDPGGFAEYFRLSPIHVHKGVFRLPDSVSFEEAIFVEPLACVLRGQRIAGARRGDCVLIIGSGMAGGLHIKLARASGAERIIAADISAYRRDMARRFGADEALTAGEGLPARVREANDGRLADQVILCTGAGPALAPALASVEPGGTVLLFAPTAPEFTASLGIHPLFWHRDVTVTTSYGATPHDYTAALGLIASQRVQVRDMISHRLGLSEAPRGFAMVAEAGESMKVVLDHRR